MISFALERRMLQVTVGVLALLPITVGFLGVTEGLGGLSGNAQGLAMLDSHFRYLSGILLAIGLSFLGTTPAIEAEGVRFRVLSGLVITGGLGRLYSAPPDMPPATIAVGLVMELVVTPALALWRERVETRFEQEAGTHAQLDTSKAN